MSAYTDHFIVLNDCRLHYQEWGDPAAPPLLFVHGLTQQSHIFDAVASHFAGRFRCIALDVRGRGQSAWAPPGTYNLPQYASDVTALLDVLEIEATDYVGTSMGGLTAMALGRVAPERLRRVVINDIGPELSPAGLERIAASVANRASAFDSLDDYIENGLVAFYYWLKSRPVAELREIARWNARQHEDGRWVARYDPASAGTTARDSESLARAAAFLWPGFRALPPSLMLVRGAESDLLSAETVQAMQSAQPSLQVVEVPGVSHAPLLDEPEARAALDTFLA